METKQQHDVAEYLQQIDTLMLSLWEKLQKLFPNLGLRKFDRYNAQVRLSTNEYKAVIWRYGLHKLAEDVEQLTNLIAEPLFDKLNRHPKLYRPQADGFDIDALADRINWLQTMLIRCTDYTSDIDPFDESGVSLLVGGGIDDLTYKLNDLFNLIARLQLHDPAHTLPAPDQTRLTDREQPGFEAYSIDKPAPAHTPPPTMKRGPYKTQKEHTVAYYQSEVRDAIAKSIRNGKDPDRSEIEGPILKRLVDKGYNERTLRDYLPAAKRTELFGEIHRQVSDIIKLNTK